MIASTPLRRTILSSAYEWCLDNNLIPYVVFDTSINFIAGLPEFLAQEQVVVLNISPEATRACQFQEDMLYVVTRFRGVSTELFIPLMSIATIHPKGIQAFFMLNTGLAETLEKKPDPEPPKPKKDRSHLRVVK